jgi:hypothetical protein
MKGVSLPILLLATVALALAAAGCRGEDTSKTGDDTKTRPGASARSAGTTNEEEPHVAKRLARAPSTCTGPTPRLVGFGDYGNLAGSSPLWAGFYAAFDPAGQRYRIERDAPRTTYGWRIKVLWIVGPKLDRPARFEAGELATGAALWFEIGEEDREPAPFGTLDPANPGVPPTNDGYKEFPSYLYVPQAGCYALEAEWPDGRWRLVFGLGR